MNNPAANAATARPTAWRRALRNRNVRLGGGVVLFWIVCAIAGPWVWSTDPFQQSLAARMLPAVWDARGNWAHPLGTDHLGRDVLARLLHGARISLAIGFGAAGIGALIGVTLGACAGFHGGRTDRAIGFVLACKLAMPGMLLAMSLIYFLSPSVLTVIAVIGMLHWTLYLIVTRSATQRIRQLDYVRASRVAGASSGRIIVSDILPNLSSVILVVFSFEAGAAILAEAALSFLGVGVPSPNPSWGLMIAEGKAAMLLRPSLVIVPGTALFVLVAGINMLGDGLRDAIQPGARE
ncbi:ABC transporter permease [Verticiella sediminum]|nr:ABC transporter permease [Verticiella sediminum]